MFIFGERDLNSFVEKILNSPSYSIIFMHFIKIYYDVLHDDVWEVLLLDLRFYQGYLMDY